MLLLWRLRTKSWLRHASTIHRPLFARSLSTRTAYSHRTEDNVIKGNSQLEYPNEDAFTFFSKKFMEYDNKVAMVNEITGATTTYTDLVKNAKKIASFFDQKGFEGGDRVCIHIPNCIEYTYSFMGTMANGMVLNPANSGYTIHEMQVMLKSSKPKVVITSSQQIDTARQSIDGSITDVLICVDDTEINDSGVVNLSDILANGKEHFTKDLSTIDPKRETGFLLYSSGTTGLPKGVMISHSAFISNVLQCIESFEDYIPSNILCVLPMYHIYGLNFITMIHMYTGSTVHLLPGFTPEQFLSSIQKNKIERIPIVPPIAIFLMNHEMVNDYDLSSLRSVTVGAAPMDEVATAKFYDKFPNASLSQGYGLTETNITHGQSRHKHLQKSGSCGQVYADTMSKVVCLETGKALGPYEQGEVCTKGPQIMTGYLDNPEATSATIDKDGYVHSGDLGYYDDDLNFYVIDRLKELIKYKAIQVAPAELEDVLLGKEDIVDACVIGIPCDKAGEIPRAYVVKKEGALLTEEDVKGYISERLSNHKRLRGGVEFIDVLPKSAAGKLLRRVLKEKYLDSIN